MTELVVEADGGPPGESNGLTNGDDGCKESGRGRVGVLGGVMGTRDMAMLLLRDGGKKQVMCD